MIYRRFGRTEINMPVISCGGMRYQQKWSDIDPSEVEAKIQANVEATIHRSVELGINHIETARGYGSSEMQLGYVLPKMDRAKLIVQTKISPFEDTQKFIDTFNTSMDYLKLEYVDLLAIHGINNRQLMGWSLRKGGCLEAARKFQEQGRCRHVGFSTHALPDVIEGCINAPGPDGKGFDYVNLHWYYIYQRNWRCVEAATKRDMGVFIISPSDKGGMLYKPSAKLVELCKPLHPIVFNDLFCLLRNQVHTLSVGAARPTDFDLHVEAVSLFEKATELVAPIEKRLEAAMKEAIGNTSPEAGLLSLPDYEHAAGGINMQIILWLLNLARGWDMEEYARMRYNLLGRGGHWFPGVNAESLDVLRDTAGPVLADLKEAHDQLAGEAVKRESQRAS